jgi:hypothetical protein
MLDKITSADFAPHLHQTFRLYHGPWDADQLSEDEARDVELIAVTDLGQEPPAGAPAPQRHPFSLTFCDRSAAPFLPQRIYSVVHTTIGRLDIFLVPIGPGEGGMRYEAVFT